MTEIELIEWLKQQHSTLDKIIANAGKEFHKDALEVRSKEQFGFDLAECQNESYNLKNNKDLCYDRPNIPFCYSLWYHGRRVNTFLSYFAKTIFNIPATEKQIEIFDLGAGTGAVQWAVGLVYHKMKEEGRQLPKIRLVNVDTSPFMLYYSKDYLWKYFIIEYKHCQDFSNDIEYEINSWNNSRNISVTNPWITASYLFDISDTKDGKNEYKTAVLRGFNEIIDKYNPSTFLLLTALSKEQLIDEVSKEFDSSKYIIEKIKYTSLILNGSLQEVSRLRTGLLNSYRTYFHTREALSIGNTASWNDVSFVGTIITKRQKEMRIVFDEHLNMKLYNPPIIIRREINLNDDQQRAAQHTEKPTIISGPAGCGKSVVITERIKNLVEKKGEEYNPNLKILLSTFNKGLIHCLKNWLISILDSAKIEKIESYYDEFKFYFKNSSVVNIRLMHFDILPTRLGIGIRQLNVGNNDYHKQLISECITELKKEKGITTNVHDNVLNPDFISEEYHRVIYGLNIDSIDEYLTIKRSGRPRLETGFGGKRELIGELIFKKYLTKISNGAMESFVTKRHRFLKQLNRNEVATKFTHIFVDEFQDCTKSDYEIFFSLLSDPNHFVIAGDIAQAITLGNKIAVNQIPRLRMEEGMGRRDFITLKGSYRVPFRIVEAIREISTLFNPKKLEEQDWSNLLTPYKGSPPGARPIIVYASTVKELNPKIRIICKSFNCFNINEVTILEGDDTISDYLNQNDIKASKKDTILRLKGLEKTCVLWSTQKDIQYKDEVAEFVYTILSRTSGILLIVLTTQTLKKYHKIIKLLRKDRLILWDRETKENFDTFCNDTQDNESNDDDE